MKSLFHLAYHVTDLDAARSFYGNVLGCREGRSTETWVDFDFFGHQISLHLGRPFEVTRTGKVGDHMVMMPHLGVVLPLDAWFELAARLESAGIAFDIPPVVRFKGEPGEQRTITFELSPRDLSFVTRDGVRQIFAGQHRVSIGSGQPDSGVPVQSESFTTTQIVPLVF